MKYDDDLDWKEKLLMVVVALLMLWIMFFGLNSFVSAADSISLLFYRKYFLILSFHNQKEVKIYQHFFFLFTINYFPNFTNIHI